jgi:integrase
MSIEPYTIHPRGKKREVVKWRVRIRTTIDDFPYKIHEVYDSEKEAEIAHERHWKVIRSGAASDELKAYLRRLAQPSMEALLGIYSKEENGFRAESSKGIEKGRLTNTIPNTLIVLGTSNEEKISETVRPGAVVKDGKVRFGDILVHAATQGKGSILEYIRQRKLAGIEGGTILREVGLISTAIDRFCDYYPSQDKPNNPCRDLTKREKPKKPKHRKRVLTADEESDMLSRADALKNPDLALSIRIALGSAMRRGEIVDLDYSNIDFEKQVASLDADKSSRLAGEVEAAGSGRQVYLMDMALDALKGRWESNKKPKSGKVFTLSPAGLKTAWRRLAEKNEEAGILNFHFHDLRHTAITRAARRGWSPIQVANAFGVADIVHLEEVFFSDKTEQVAESIKSGRSLTSDELAYISGHRDKSMLQTYANLKPEDLHTAKLAAMEQTPRAVPKITYRMENNLCIATLPDGNEVRGTPVEVRALVKALTE